MVYGADTFHRIWHAPTCGAYAWPDAPADIGVGEGAEMLHPRHVVRDADHAVHLAIRGRLRRAGDFSNGSNGISPALWRFASRRRVLKPSHATGLVQSFIAQSETVESRNSQVIYHDYNYLSCNTADLDNTFTADCYIFLFPKIAPPCDWLIAEESND